MKRLEQAVKAAQQAFWAEVARHFPEVKTGDFPMDAQMAFESSCLEAIQTWGVGNGGRLNFVGTVPATDLPSHDPEEITVVAMHGSLGPIEVTTPGLVMPNGDVYVGETPFSYGSPEQDAALGEDQIDLHGIRWPDGSEALFPDPTPDPAAGKKIPLVAVTVQAAEERGESKTLMGANALVRDYRERRLCNKIDVTLVFADQRKATTTLDLFDNDGIEEHLRATLVSVRNRIARGFQGDLPGMEEGYRKLEKEFVELFERYELSDSRKTPRPSSGLGM